MPTHTQIDLAAALDALSQIARHPAALLAGGILALAVAARFMARVL